MRLYAALVFSIFICLDGRAEELSNGDLPPELEDINLSTHKDGFVNLFDSYNPRGFSIYSANLGLKLGSFEYYSGSSIYGHPGDAEPIFYKTKQNLYYAPTSSIPFDLSTQMMAATAAYPVYRVGVRWKVSSTAGVKQFFERIRLGYSINFQPLQFDSVPGYNWQVEHIYQLNFTDRLLLRGTIDQDGGVAGTTVSLTNQLNYRVFDPFALFTEYKYAKDAPVSNYGGFSFGIEYRISF